MGKYDSLLEYSTKIYGFKQSKVLETFGTTYADLQSSTDNEIIALCKKGTCGALAARWAFEQASKEWMKNEHRMFKPRRTAKSHYQQRKNEALQPFRQRELNPENPLSDRGAQEWAKVAEIEAERKKKKKALLERHARFYKLSGQMQAAGLKRGLTFSTIEIDAIGLFIDNINEKILATKYPAREATFSPKFADFNNPMGADNSTLRDPPPLHDRSGPVQLTSLDCLKGVVDASPLYIAYRLENAKATSEDDRFSAHAIALVRGQKPPFRFFEPNAGDYKINSEKNWGDFIDEYMTIIKNDFHWTVTNVRLYRVRVIET
jgi:hypothetical protein